MGRVGVGWGEGWGVWVGCEVGDNNQLTTIIAIKIYMLGSGASLD